MPRAAGRPKGTPNTWTPERKAEAFTRICSEIALGKSLRKICEAPDLPHIDTALDWISGDDDYGRRYARAREAQADFYADEIVEIADTEADANKARVRIDSRKWVASKLKSRTYGDKIAHVGGGDDDPPIKTDDLSNDARRVAFMLGRAVGQQTKAGAE